MKEFPSTPIVNKKRELKQEKIKWRNLSHFMMKIFAITVLLLFYYLEFGLIHGVVHRLCLAIYPIKDQDMFEVIFK